MALLGCCIPGGSFMPQGENEVPASPKEILRTGTKTVIDAGFDYAEISAGFLAQLSDEDVAELETENLPIRACNSFIPPVLPIWDAAKKEELFRYVDKVLSYCGRLGIAVMVFGSGAARRMPDGMTLEEGHKGMVRFLKECAPYAAKYGVTIALEPLNREECNILTTVSEGAEICRAVNDPNIRLLADAFHVFKENEDLNVLPDNKDILVHIHVAETPDRVYPGRDGGEYLRKFAEYLKKSGYSGRVSVECGFDQFEEEARASYPFMKEVFA